MAKQAASQNSAIGLNGEAGDFAIGTRIEARVNTAVRVKPGDIAPDYAVDHRKSTPDKDFTVGLNGDGVNAPVDIRREARVRDLAECLLHDEPGAQKACSQLALESVPDVRGS